MIKTELTQSEINEIRDLVCEATLYKSAEHKQYFLLKIGGILAGTEDEFIYSGEAQGYIILRGVKP